MHCLQRLAAESLPCLVSCMLRVHRVCSQISSISFVLPVTVSPHCLQWRGIVLQQVELALQSP